MLPSFPVDTSFVRGFALALAAILLREPVAWIGNRSVPVLVRDFLVKEVERALLQAGNRPTLDQIAAPVIHALLGTEKPLAVQDPLLPPSLEDGDQQDLDRPPILDPFRPLRNAWKALLIILTVRADRLGFARLRGPLSGGHRVFLWAVYDSPPEQDDVRALHPLHPSLDTPQYRAGLAWVNAQLETVPYGTWLWAKP